jgi:large subunit ribosomal protein L18
MANTNPKLLARERRRKSLRKRIRGTNERPRIAVFRSARHIYAQIIDDVTGRTLVSASTLCEELPKNSDDDKKATAHRVGELLAQRALAADIRQVVFDRGGYLYHGRVAALADGARAGGLDF